ncbi:LuxR C-terminal-related transcriptional regulator [Brachyspira alvinipulli]|uniref:LuxR C-terminal-related transcriptional regulator n=1 Tax=Brachyspira alvinipulli TaxID=84379 RepID=UPI0004B4FBFE|nr:LuxR C-terminal-related transcriptional regulator [Brachyspira alvinipulli]
MKITCDKCKHRKECKKLCNDMEKVLANSLKNNECYADNTFLNKSTSYNDAYSNILYTFGCSDDEEKKIRKVIVAILSKEQKQILNLYAKGFTQEQIASVLGTTQANISHKLKIIKNDIKKGVIGIIEKIIDL